VAPVSNAKNESGFSIFSPNCAGNLCPLPFDAYMPPSKGKGKREERSTMDSKDQQEGKVIARTAVALAAGVSESQLKNRLWGIALNAMGAEGSAEEKEAARHMVRTELCTFCREHNLIACNGDQADCDLIHIISSGTPT
jgi:hypothetical protein